MYYHSEATGKRSLSDIATLFVVDVTRISVHDGPPLWSSGHSS
jgi:hypothetical protein